MNPAFDDFLISLSHHVLKSVFFIMDRILESPTLVVFHGLPGLLVLLNLNVQTVNLTTPKIFAVSYGFIFFCLTIASFTSTPRIIYCLICHEIISEYVTPNIKLPSASESGKVCMTEKDGVSGSIPCSSYDCNPFTIYTMYTVAS